MTPAEAGNVIQGLCNVPSAPTVLAITNEAGGVGSGALNNNDSAVLTWTAASGYNLDGYKVDSSTDGGATWTAETSVNGAASTTTTIDLSTDGNPDGTDYTFRVVASNIACTPDQDTPSVNLGPINKGKCTVPSDPATLIINNEFGGAGSGALSNDDTAELVWTALTDYNLSGYLVETSPDSGTTWVAGTTVSGAASTTTTLDLSLDDATYGDGTSYSFRLTGLNENCTPGATQVSVTPKLSNSSVQGACNIPTAPASVTVTNAIGTGSIAIAEDDTAVLTWTATASDYNLGGFYVQSSPDNATWVTETTISNPSATTTTFDVSADADGTSYYYQVIAYNDLCPLVAGGTQTTTSVASAGSYVKGLCDTMTFSGALSSTTSAIDSGNGEITLNWGVADAHLYLNNVQIWKQEETSPAVWSAWTQTDVAVAATTYTYPQAHGADTYRYLVRAYNTTCDPSNFADTNTIDVADTDACLYYPSAITGPAFTHIDEAGNSISGNGTAPYDYTNPGNDATFAWTPNALDTDVTSYIIVENLSSDAGVTWPTFTTLSAAYAGVSYTQAEGATTTAAQVKYQVYPVDSCATPLIGSLAETTILYAASCDATATALVTPGSDVNFIYSYDDASGNVAPNPVEESAAGLIEVQFQNHINCLAGDGPGWPTVVGYNIYLDKNGAGATQIEASYTGTSTCGLEDFVYNTNDPNGDLDLSDADPSGTTYQFTFEAITVCALISPTGAATDLIVKGTCSDGAPVAPTVLAYGHSDGIANGDTLDDNGSSIVTLTWTASTSSDVATYEVFASIDGAILAIVPPAAVTAISSSGATIDLSLWPAAVTNSELYFSVRVTDFCGIQSVDSNLTGTIKRDSCDVAPGVPTALVYTHDDGIVNASTLDASTADIVSLSWTAPVDADLTTYNVYYNKGAGSVLVPSTHVTFVGTTANINLDNLTGMKFAGLVNSGDVLSFTVRAVDFCLREGLDSNSTSDIMLDSCDGAPTVSALGFTHTDEQSNSNPPYDYTVPADDAAFSWTSEADTQSYVLTQFVSTDYGVTWGVATTLASGYVPTSYTAAEPSTDVGVQVKYAVTPTDYCLITGATVEATDYMFTSSCDAITLAQNNVNPGLPGPGLQNNHDDVDDLSVVVNFAPDAKDFDAAGNIVVRFPNFIGCSAGVLGVGYPSIAGFNIYLEKDGVVDFNAPIETGFTGIPNYCNWDTYTYIPNAGDADGTTYQFYVKAVSVCGVESPSGDPTPLITKGTCSDGAPVAPTVLAYGHSDGIANGDTLDDNGSSIVTLTWTASTSSDVATYEVFASIDGAILAIVPPAAVTAISSSGATIDLSLWPAAVTNSELYFSVRVTDFCGIQSVDSNLTGTIKRDSCDVAPGVPTALVYTHDDGIVNASTLDASTADIVSLSWTAPVDADLTTYNVYYNKGAGSVLVPSTHVTFVGTTANINLDNLTGMKFAGLVNSGDVLSFTVRAVDFCLREGLDSNSTSDIMLDSCDGAPTVSALGFTHTDEQSNSNPPYDYTVPADDAAFSWTSEADTQSYVLTQFVSTDYGVTWGVATTLASGYVPTSYTAAEPSTDVGVQVKYAVTPTDYCLITGATVEATDYMFTSSCDQVELDNIRVVPGFPGLGVTNNHTDGTNIAPNAKDVDVSGNIVVRFPNYTGCPAGASGLGWPSIAGFNIYLEKDGVIDFNAPLVTGYTGVETCNWDIYTYNTDLDADGTTYQFYFKAVSVCGVESPSGDPTPLIMKGTCDAEPSAFASIALTHTDLEGNSSPPLDYDDAAGDADFNWTLSAADFDIVSYDIYENLSEDGGVTWNLPTNLELAYTTGTNYTTPHPGYFFGDQVKYSVTATDYCGKTSLVANETSVLYSEACASWWDSNPPWDPDYDHTDAGGNWDPPLDVDPFTEEILIGYTPTECWNTEQTYNIYESLDGGAMTLKEASYSGTPGSCVWEDYVIPTLGDPNGSTYTYQFTWQTACKESSAYTLSTITKGVCTVAPDAPTDLISLNAPANQPDASGNVYLSWTAPSGLIASYSIYQWDSVSGVWGVAPVATSTSLMGVVNVSAYANGTTFQYRVTATSDCGALESLPSTVSAVITKPACAPIGPGVPPVPAGLFFTNADIEDVDGAGNVGLEWLTLPGGADGYNVYQAISTDYGDSWAPLTLVATTADLLTNTASISTGADIDGTRYAYAITSYRTLEGSESCASSVLGDVVKGTCSDGAPDTPVIDTSVLCAATEDRRVDIPLAPSGDLENLELYFCDDGSGCAVTTLIDNFDLSGYRAGGTFDFVLPEPYHTAQCGQWYVVKTFDYCGNESALSNSW